MTIRRELPWVALVWVAAMLVVLREPLLSGFDLGFGDRADAIIEISLLEHWRNVFTGHAVWNVTGYFHPYAGTLGYNDGYFLYGAVYSFWRLWFDPFVSDTLNMATWKTIGFFAAWLLARRTLGWDARTALIVAAFFTISNNLVVQTEHAQIHIIALLPVVMMLAIAAFRAEAAGRRGAARVRALTCAAVLAAWLITAYYMAWFTLFFTMLLVACWLWRSGQLAPRPLLALGREHAGTIGIALIGFAVMIVPFLSVYLPKVSETGGHHFGPTSGYLVTPVIDWINTGPDNLVWGWIQQLLRAGLGALAPSDPGMPGRVFGGEHESGFPILFFALTLVSAHAVLIRRRLPDGTAPGTFLAAYAMAVMIGWLLTIQLGPVSPWRLVFELVQGAKGLRTVLRYQLFLVLPLLLLILAVQRHHIATLFATRPALAWGLAALFVAEQINLGTNAQLSRATSLAALETLPPPSSDCTSFYVVTARVNEPQYRDPKANGRHPHNVDAMYLAQRWHLPTLNGHSTFLPPDWDFLMPRSADYDARVGRYITAHRLKGVCRLDARDPHPWRRVS